MIEPSDVIVSAGGGAALMKAFDFFVRRYVSKADAREEAAEQERKAAEKDATAKRDEREKDMGQKLDQLLLEVASLTGEVRNDRERSAATASAIQAAVSEVKARIDGVSANHGPRLGAVEQELAALRARVDLSTRRRR